MIDLIIPAYNAENTIARALGSVVAQTKPRKFMVTVVDDCSTDATAAIVQKFKGLIPLNYIKLEKNLGKPGLVRQVGIDNTCCPYIMFLDADDILCPIAGEIMSRSAMQNNYDFTVGRFFHEQERTKSEKNMYEIYSEESLTWLHGNLYKRQFLDKYNIKFDDRMNEDGNFNLKCAYLSNTMGFIEEPISYWLNNTQSITRSNNDFLIEISEDLVNTYIEAINFVIEKSPDIGDNFEFKKEVCFKLSMFLEVYEANLYYNSPKDKIDRILTSIQNYVKMLLNNNLLNKDNIDGVVYYINQYKTFSDILRTYGHLELFRLVGINYEEIMNG